MPIIFMRVGGLIMLAGLILFFFRHSILLSALVIGLGFVPLVLGIIGWSLENGGDVSFS
jgi:hypothetical protein